MESLFPLFNSNGFMPHGMCFSWRQDILYTQVAADAITGLAYYGITAALAYIFIKRHDIPYRWFVIPFGILMFFACGTSHFFSIWTIWNPDFGTEVVIKAFTGVASASTAIMLWYLMPQVIALPGPTLLRIKNEELENQIFQRRSAEQKIQDLNVILEKRVQERTRQLEDINEKLRKEITERQRAEEALRESAMTLSAIFEQAAIGVALIESRNGKFARINKKYCDITGYSYEEMLSLDFMQITHPDDLQEDLDKMQLLLDGKINEFSIQKRYIKNDNSIVWVNLTVSPMWKTGEQADNHIAVVEDITERKQIENALQNIVEGTAPHIGQNFFRTLVNRLAGALDVKYAFVGELFDDQKDVIQTVAVWSGESYAENFQYKVAGTPCEMVVARELCGYPKDIQKKFPDDHLLVEMNAESYVGMPLLDSDGKVLGILVVLDVKPIENISLIESLIPVFADRAAVELERKHAESKALQLLQQNRELTQRMFKIQEDERRYLGRELHDEFGQQLAAIHLNAETIKMLSKKQYLKIYEYAQVIDEIATDVHKKMRSILRQLRPALLDEMGLVDSLKELTNQWQVRFPTIKIKFSMEGELNDFDDNLNISIYRIIQESLTNVAKHAMADYVSVQLIRQPGERGAQDSLLLIVKDNGKGLDETFVAEGIGLPSLRERVLAVGGKFAIKSIKEKGVHVEVWIPINVTL